MAIHVLTGSCVQEEVSVAIVVVKPKLVLKVFLLQPVGKVHGKQCRRSKSYGMEQWEDLKGSRIQDPAN